MNKRIGILLPFLFLLIFGLLFHPSTQIFLQRFQLSLSDFFLSPQTFFLLSSLWIIIHRKIKPSYVGVTIPRIRYIGSALMLGLFPYLVLAVVNYNVGKVIPTNVGYKELSLTYSVIIPLFIMAPITEELFFRGVLFTALKESFSVTVSVIASALLFMASHSPLALGPLVLGIIAAILTQKSKSILPAIIFHVLSNGLPVFFANYCQNLYPFQKYLFLRF